MDKVLIKDKKKFNKPTMKAPFTSQRDNVVNQYQSMDSQDIKDQHYNEQVIDTRVGSRSNKMDRVIIKQAMIGYVYKNENIEGDDFGPVIGEISGETNEEVEKEFEDRYGSNDYSLSYSK